MIIYTLWQQPQDGDVPSLLDAMDEYTIDSCDFSPEYKEKRERGNVRELIINVPENAVRTLFDTPVVKATIVEP